MNSSDDLYNAAVIGENGNNPDVTFIAEGKRLHAVEEHIAKLKKDKADPKLVLPLMRNAYKVILDFARRTMPETFDEIELKEISLKPEEKDQLIEKIQHIYQHLHHRDRNELSSLIHHKHYSL